MKIVAKYAVELNGHIYRKGEECDYSGAITDRIKSCFVCVDGTALECTAESKSEDKAEDEPTKNPQDNIKSQIEKIVSVMKREGIMQALDNLGVTYSPKSKTEYLAKLLLMNRGEIEEV